MCIETPDFSLGVVGCLYAVSPLQCVSQPFFIVLLKVVGRRNEKVEKTKKLLNFFIELNRLSEEMKKFGHFPFFNSTVVVYGWLTM